MGFIKLLLENYKFIVVIVFPQAPFRVTNIPGPTPVSSNCATDWECIINMINLLNCPPCPPISYVPDYYNYRSLPSPTDLG